MRQTEWRDWLILAVAAVVTAYCGYVAIEAIVTGEITTSVGGRAFRRTETFTVEKHFADFCMGVGLHLVVGSVGAVAAYRYWSTRIAPEPASTDEDEEPSPRPFGQAPPDWREKH